MYKENKLCCVNNYTKVSDKLVAKYGIKIAYVYAKLSYRMKLSLKHPKQYLDDNGHFIIYKINDLKHDCHLGRNTIINILNKMDKKLHLIHKERTAFSNKIYLPKFDKSKVTFKNQTSQSSKSKLPKQQKYNNKLNNNYVSSSSCYSVSNAKQIHKTHYPNIGKIIDRFGKPLFNYALHIYHIYIESGKRVHNSIHFIYGILRRWQRKGIKTVNKAMKSEGDCHAQTLVKGPRIPIFKI